MKFNPRPSDSTQILCYHPYFPLLKTHYDGRSRFRWLGIILWILLWCHQMDRVAAPTPNFKDRVYMCIHTSAWTFHGCSGIQRGHWFTPMQKKTSKCLSHLLTIMLHRFFQQTCLGCEYNFPFILLPNFFLPQYTFPFPFHFTLNLLITIPIELYRGIRWFTC